MVLPGREPPPKDVQGQSASDPAAAHPPSLSAPDPLPPPLASPQQPPPAPHPAALEAQPLPSGGSGGGGSGHAQTRGDGRGGGGGKAAASAGRRGRSALVDTSSDIVGRRLQPQLPAPAPPPSQPGSLTSDSAPLPSGLSLSPPLPVTPPSQAKAEDTGPGVHESPSASARAGASALATTRSADVDASVGASAEPAAAGGESRASVGGTPESAAAAGPPSIMPTVPAPETALAPAPAPPSASGTTTPAPATIASAMALAMDTPGSWAAALDVDSPHGSTVDTEDWEESWEHAARTLTQLDSAADPESGVAKAEDVDISRGGLSEEEFRALQIPDLFKELFRPQY